MASRSGIITAQREIAALWTLSRGQKNRLDEDLGIWQARLTDVPDEQLLATIRSWPDKKKPPTLAELTPGAPTKTAGPATDGCTACKATGTRQVVRHTSDGRMQELAARCPCQAGDRRKGQGFILLADLVERWTQASDTLDGPHVDPEPAHRLAPTQRPAFLARAEARLRKVQANVPSANESAPSLW